MTENAMDAQRQHSTDPAEGADPDDVTTGQPEPREHTEEHAEGDDD